VVGCLCVFTWLLIEDAAGFFLSGLFLAVLTYSEGLQHLSSYADISGKRWCRHYAKLFHTPVSLPHFLVTVELNNTALPNPTRTAKPVTHEA
jgi:hypothetical protein